MKLTISVRQAIEDTGWSFVRAEVSPATLEEYGRLRERWEDPTGELHVDLLLGDKPSERIQVMSFKLRREDYDGKTFADDFLARAA